MTMSAVDISHEALPSSAGASAADVFVSADVGAEVTDVLVSAGVGTRLTDVLVSAGVGARVTDVLVLFTDASVMFVTPGVGAADGTVKLQHIDAYSFRLPAQSDRAFARNSSIAQDPSPAIGTNIGLGRRTPSPQIRQIPSEAIGLSQAQ